MLGQLTALLIQTQRRLEALYALEPGPAITDFIQLDPSNGEERLLVRQVDTETLEIRLVLPSNIDPEAPPQSDDHVEVVEGVSHFVHLAERARTRLPTWSWSSKLRWTNSPCCGTGWTHSTPERQ